MAAFNRPTEATYEVHEKVTVDTNGKICRILSKKSCYPNRNDWLTPIVSPLLLLSMLNSQIMRIIHSGKFQNLFPSSKVYKKDFSYSF